MIKTKDHKKFFTYEKNFPQLIEFSKTFNAEISKVQIPNEIEVLELEELAPALCEKKSQITDYTILEVKLKPKDTRKDILFRSKKIQKYIENKLLNKETVSLKDLTKKFKGITTACLCNHFKLIRNKMALKGLSFTKIGGGKYKLV